MLYQGLEFRLFYDSGQKRLSSACILNFKDMFPYFFVSNLSFSNICWKTWAPYQCRECYMHAKMRILIAQSDFFSQEVAHTMQNLEISNKI